MKLTERINFRQPKYMLPAIVYLPLLGASYFIFDLDCRLVFYLSLILAENIIEEQEDAQK